LHELDREMDNSRPDKALDTDRRQDRRARVQHGATIDFVDQPVVIDCVVSDLSESGARLETEHAEHVPQSFDVIVNDSNEVYPAKRVWHGDGEVGVTFLAPEKD
jgi:hypothetical protein